MNWFYLTHVDWSMLMIFICVKPARTGTKQRIFELTYSYHATEYDEAARLSWFPSSIFLSLYITTYNAASKDVSFEDIFCTCFYANP